MYWQGFSVFIFLMVCSSAHCRLCSTVSGSVYIDANGDSAKGASEKLVQGVKLTIATSSNNIISSTASDASGSFIFKGDFHKGRYYVRSSISTLSVPVQIEGDDDVIGVLFPLSMQQFTASSGQDVKESQSGGTSSVDSNTDRPALGLSKTQIIIIGSCIAAVIVAAVLVGIIVHRRKVSKAAPIRPQIVIAAGQVYSPPAASAPPLQEDSSFDFEKPRVTLSS